MADARKTAEILHYAFKGLEVPVIRGVLKLDYNKKRTGISFPTLSLKDYTLLDNSSFQNIFITKYTTNNEIIRRKTALVTGAARGIGKPSR